MTLLQVRCATAADAAAIAQVHVLSWQHAYRALLPQTFLDGLSIASREALWARNLASGLGTVLVAQRQQDVVGFAAFGARRDAGAAFEEHELWAIYLAPAHWRQGAGRRLWAECLHRMVADGALSISVWVLAGNAPARRFYEALEFRPACDERALEIGGASVSELRYVRAVADAIR